MKNIFTLFFFVFCLIATTNPLQAQWIQTNCPYGSSVSCFTVSGTNIFAGINNGGGVFLSTNNGTSWTNVNNGLTDTSVRALAISGTNLFAGTASGVFLSTNNGTRWSAVNSGLTGTVNAFAIYSTNLFAATYDGVFLSTNNGSSWTNVSGGMYTNTPVFALAVSGTDVFAGTYSDGRGVTGGVWRYNGLGSWTHLSGGTLNSTSINGLVVSGTNLFALSGGIYISSGNGNSWAEISQDFWWNFNGAVTSLAFGGTNFFAGTTIGVLLSTNNGTSWTTIDSGLTSTYVQALAVSGTYLLAGTNHGVCRRPLSEMIPTGVNDNNNQIPISFALDQNYPNPFNPTTTISFSFPSKSFVTLKMFDILGKEVATIISEEMSAGSYSRQWNAANMSSGIYFYRLQAGSFTETKKLILLK